MVKSPFAPTVIFAFCWKLIYFKYDKFFFTDSLLTSKAEVKYLTSRRNGDLVSLSGDGQLRVLDSINFKIKIYQYIGEANGIEV